MRANLTYDQRKALLMGLGYRVEQTGTSPEYSFIRPNGTRRDWFDSEESAWEVSLDMNFCFEVLVPWMKAKGWGFMYQNEWACFSKDGGFNHVSRDDNPATAICLAVLQFMESEK